MYLFCLNCFIILNSCIYSVHVFIIFEFMYLLFLNTCTYYFFKLFLFLLFLDKSFAISILKLNDIHI